MLLQRVRVPLFPSAELSLGQDADGAFLFALTANIWTNVSPLVTGAQGTGPREPAEGGRGLR